MLLYKAVPFLLSVLMLSACFEHPGGTGDTSDAGSEVGVGITLSSDTMCMDSENLEALEAGGVVYGCMIDSLVVGIDYRTASQSGVTDEYGRFRFKQGEDITFSIGDLDLPSVAASVEVTPFTIGGTDDVSEPMVRNIGLLLQSIDLNNDPDDGITLTQEIKDKFIGFPHGTSIFSEADVDVFKGYFSGILIDGANPIPFRSVAEVEAHLGKIAPVYGRWYAQLSSDENDIGFLFMRQNNKYSYLEQNTGRFEVGTFSRVGGGAYSFTTLTTPVSGLQSAGTVNMNFTSDSLGATILGRNYKKGYSFAEQFGEAYTKGFRNMIGGWELASSTVISETGVYLFVDPNSSYGMFSLSGGVATSLEKGDISVSTTSAHDSRFKATVTIAPFDEIDPAVTMQGLVPGGSRSFIFNLEEDATVLTIEEPCAACGDGGTPSVTEIARFNRVL